MQDKSNRKVMTKHTQAREKWEKQTRELLKLYDCKEPFDGIIKHISQLLQTQREEIKKEYIVKRPKNTIPEWWEIEFIEFLVPLTSNKEGEK